MGDIVLSVPTTGAIVAEPRRVMEINAGFWGSSRLVYTSQGSLLADGISCSTWEHPSDAQTSLDAFVLYKLGLYSVLESSVYGWYFDMESAFLDAWLDIIWPITRPLKKSHH